MPDGYKLLNRSIESLLLCLINKQPMYGYQVIKELRDRSEGYFQFKEGTLYPALHRMEKSGQIEGTWEVLSNGQHRKYYHITDKGYESLCEKLSHWNDFFTAMNLIIQP